jgi:hypothetical protein
VQAANRFCLLLRGSRRLEREDGEEERVAYRRKSLLDNLLWLTGDRRLLRDVDLALSDRSCEALYSSGSAWLVGWKEKGCDGNNSEDSRDSRVQNDTRCCRSMKGLSFVLPSLGTGDKPAGMPLGPDGGPPGTLPELAFLQQNYDTRCAHLNSASQQ